jgi:mRNA-degrading endonuclease toxin of MazEF toxin-antitoxin module
MSATKTICSSDTAGNVNVGNLTVGSIVRASLSIGSHPAIVLSTEQEIEDTGTVFVVAISSNTTLSLPEDLIEVTRGLGMKKKCFVQCGVVEMLPRNQVAPTGRKAWGTFLEQVRKQVRIATDRAKKSTPS